MIRHLFKLVWNRKRTNGLIILEIFFSFLVVFVVGTLGIFLWDNYRQPLGYSWQNVWQISVESGRSDQQENDAMVIARMKTFERLIREIEALEPVDSAAAAMISPYDRGGWTSNVNVGGRRVEMEASAATTHFAEVMGMEMAAGRWF